LAPSDEISCGLCYGTTSRFCTWHRSVERAVSVLERSHFRDRVRGVYWGTLFGAAVLRRLGGIDAFEKEFNERCNPRRGGAASLVTRLPRGAALVRLTPTLQEIWPGSGRMGHQSFDPASKAAAWLHIRLREAGVLL
jgi:hypothetical protein